MEWFARYYKPLFLIPIILLVLSIGVIAWTAQDTGSFVRKGVTLSGGVSATVTLEDATTAPDIGIGVERAFPGSDVEVRRLGRVAGADTYVIDAAHIDGDSQAAAEALQNHLESTYSVSSISIETTGPSLGNAFFAQTIIGILLAFLWMGWVVYLYFGDSTWLKFIMALVALTATVLAVKGVLDGTTGIIALLILALASMVLYIFVSVPSGAVILAAMSTIVFTLAVINLIGLRLSTAGVAAFLMLIGYSVDTDILLSTRVLRNREGTVSERIWNAFKTGATMQGTTIVAVLAAYLLSSSDVIRQIMLIIFIGMIGDFIFTWLQNAGIIYWYAERNKGKVKGVRA